MAKQTLRIENSIMNLEETRELIAILTKGFDNTTAAEKKRIVKLLSMGNVTIIDENNIEHKIS